MPTSEAGRPKRYLLYAVRGYSLSILRPLQTAIRRRGDEAAWFVRNVPKEKFLPDEKVLRSVDEVLQFASDTVLVPTNWVPDFFPGIKVQLFHAAGVGKRGHFRIRGFFDLYCTHGPSTTGPFRELAARHRHFTVAETGWPKLDPLFAAAHAPEKPDPRPLILYAPTFSASMTSATALYEEVLRLSRQGKWRFVVKFHELMDPAVMERYRAAQHEGLQVADEKDSIIPLLQEADLMVTDTSSVIIEFLFLGKPVVTFRSEFAGPYVSDFSRAEELEERIERAFSPTGELREAAAEFVRMEHPHRDGRSAERVLDAVDHFLADPPKLARKPLNLIRKLRMRKRLGYYRW